MKNEKILDATNPENDQPKPWLGSRRSRINRLCELGVHVDQSTTQRRLEAIERLVAAKPSLCEKTDHYLPRLRADEIEAARGAFPKVRTVCGGEWLVDFCGTMHVGRLYKIDFRGFEHYVPIAKKFLQQAIDDGAIIKKPTICSYDLKHYFQTSLGYVSNGAMIIAAARLRIPLHYNEINVRLPISRVWLRKWEETESDRARGEVPMDPAVIDAMVVDETLRSLNELKNNRPNTWQEKYRQWVGTIARIRELECSLRLKTERNRRHYMDQIASFYKMPELIQNISMFWKVEKNYRHWYVQFDEPNPRVDVIVSPRIPSLLVLGLDRAGIDHLASIAGTFRPRPILQTNDRFLAPKLSFAQIVELLEVVQERVGRFATSDFLPTIEEWDRADA